MVKRTDSFEALLQENEKKTDMTGVRFWHLILDSFKDLWNIVLADQQRPHNPLGAWPSLIEGPDSQSVNN